MATEKTWDPRVTEDEGKRGNGATAENSGNDVWEDCLESDVTRDRASTPTSSRLSHGQETPSAKPPNVGQLWEVNASLTKQIADLQFQLQRIIKNTKSDTSTLRNLRGSVRQDTNVVAIQEQLKNLQATTESDVAKDTMPDDEQAKPPETSSNSPGSPIVLHENSPEETTKISSRSPGSPIVLHQKPPEETTKISSVSPNLPSLLHGKSPEGTPRLSYTPPGSPSLWHPKSPSSMPHAASDSPLALDIPARAMDSLFSVSTPCRDRAPEERDEMELRRCRGTSDLDCDMTPDADFHAYFANCESPSDVGTPLSNFGFPSDMAPPGRVDGILYVRRKLTWAKRFASAEGAFLVYRKSRLSSVRFRGCLPEFTVQYLGYRRKSYRLLLKPKEPRSSDDLPDSLQLLLPREDVAEKWFRVLEWGSRLPKPEFEP
eukprot:GEMP01028038.1.p1 GENE.GEMP01028038.1~~GEMP01028038.1.p1  ORF type:complete len:431 (+),score=76.08 GEMP01028038.1:78-1370(+)